MKATIGSAIDVQWESDDPQTLVVSQDALSEPVELAGGEAVELFVSQDGQSLISAAYDAGAPIFGTLLGGLPRDPQGLRVGAHQPVREGNTVTFDLSLQSAQQRFVSRPREVWIEITPILADNRPAANLKYVFYDPEFVPQTPVPVLRNAARNWPKSARRARIDFWCKWSATEPTRLIPLADLGDGNQPASTPATLDGIPGLQYQVRSQAGAVARFDFIETYAADTAGGTMIKVDIAGSVLPTRTLHQFDEANHFATHSFLFDGVSSELLRAADSIRVISRRRMLDDALHLELPISIEVPEKADVVPSLPPAN